MKEIAIYGTGSWGNMLYNMLTGLSVQISCFLKTTPKDGETYKDIKVISAEELFRQNERAIVVIAIKDKQAVRQIYDNLLEIGLKKNQVIVLNNTIYSYILDNASAMQTGGGYYCPCCESSVIDFAPYNSVKSEAFENYKIIGGGYREHAICPICNCSDRNRWQKYVLENFTDISHTECNVLHIAPEKDINRWVSHNGKCDYYSGDIALGNANHRVDLTDIQFKEDFFDYIIANHVLEHIENIDLAFSEIRRVLKPDGKLIVSFPICMDVITKEDKTISRPEDRLREFGQSDHVRLFGNDYKEYIEKYGFNVEVKSPKDCLADDMIKKYGLIKDDIMLICSILK